MINRIEETKEKDILMLNIIEVSIKSREYKYDHTNPFGTHQTLEVEAKFNGEVLYKKTCSSIYWIKHDFNDAYANEKYKKIFPDGNYQLKFNM